VIEKTRHGGDLAGQRVFYAIGPQRRTREAAERDAAHLRAGGGAGLALAPFVDSAMPLDRLDLGHPTRTANAFRRRGLVTVGDVLRVVSSGRSLAGFKGIGPATVEDFLTGLRRAAEDNYDRLLEQAGKGERA
jgi:hypothetical protein